MGGGRCGVGGMSHYRLCYQCYCWYLLAILEPLCHVPFKHCLIELSPKLYKVNVIVISISEIRILRLRERLSISSKIKYLLGADQFYLPSQPVLNHSRLTCIMGVHRL